MPLGRLRERLVRRSAAVGPRWPWYPQGRRHVPTNEADERGVSDGDFRVDPDAHRRQCALWLTRALYGA